MTLSLGQEEPKIKFCRNRGHPIARDNPKWAALRIPGSPALAKICPELFCQSVSVRPRARRGVDVGAARKLAAASGWHRRLACRYLRPWRCHRPARWSRRQVRIR